jgi:hypothetical protein
MATLEVHTARWLRLPWVESMWSGAVGDALLPAVQRRIILPMLERGLDPGRHRFAFSLHRDSSAFLKIETTMPDRRGGAPRQWLLREHHAGDDAGWLEDLSAHIDRLADHYVRRDRILAHLGEAGRFRRHDPAWSYDIHPVLAAHVAGHGMTPDGFVRDIVTAGPFRSNGKCLSRPTDKDAVICSLPERLGYLDGEVEGGDILLGRIDLSRQVSFVGSRSAIVVRGCAMPETVLAGIVGQHALAVVDHHAFDVPGLTVTATRRRGGNVEFLVPCRPVPFAKGRPSGLRASAAPIPCTMPLAA